MLTKNIRGLAQSSYGFVNTITLPKSYQSNESLQLRSIHTVPISRNLKFFSNEKVNMDKTRLQIEADGTKGKPLVLLYTWMMAKERHALKYAKLYTDLGADVLKVRLTPMDLLRPTKGSQVVAQNVLDFLEGNDKFGPLLVHGFSVGAYAFCEAMVKMESDMKRYRSVHERFVGQIWDSPVDIEGIPSGLSKAVTDNLVLQTSLERYFQWFLKMNYVKATQHYIKSSEMMHANFVDVPALFLFSNSDPVSPPAMNEKCYNNYDQVFVKCFDKSAHVSHYLRYKDEYEAEMMCFLEKIGMANQNAAKASNMSD